MRTRGSFAGLGVALAPAMRLLPASAVNYGEALLFLWDSVFLFFIGIIFVEIFIRDFYFYLNLCR